MILTGKALEDFDNWLNNVKLRSDSLASLTKPEQLYYVIEWFDNVGIIINTLTLGLQRRYFYEIKTFERMESHRVHNTRQEAIEEAIKKANEIYNKT